VTARLISRIVGIFLAVCVLGFPPSPAFADEVRDAQWHLPFLHVAEAAQQSRGEGVVVAVVDSGVDSSHQDLAGAILPGFNVAGTDDARTDSDGHGTAMAGLIVGRGQQGGRGVLGVAPDAVVLPVRIGDRSRPLIAEAISWAVQHGAKVISVAVGEAGNSKLEAAVQDALDADVVIVASMGNRPKTGVQAPARYSGVIAVTGVDRGGTIAEISVTGPEAVLAAPAVDIVSTNAGGGYRVGTGTSDATAIIAGVAALVRSKFPQLSAEEVTNRMAATATDKGKHGRDEEYGYGIVDPVAALTADVLPQPGDTPSTQQSAEGAQPPPSDRGGSPLIGWILGAVLLAAVGVGAVIVIRGAHR
jgi:type VII secretion-associated serine protease mycosin